MWDKEGIGDRRDVFQALKSGHLFLNHPSDQLSPRTPFAIFTPRHSLMPRSTSVQTSSTKISSPLSALHPANHRFFTPLFSSTSEPLFSQLLSFQIYLRCPLAFSSHASIQRIWPISSLRSVRLCGKSRRFRRLAPL